MKIVIDISEKYYEYIQNLPHYKRNYEQDLILDGDIIEEDTDQKSLEEWTSGEENRWESEEV